MSRFLRHEQCPRCAARGADRRGNNLGTYSDGSKFCFSCGYREQPTFKATFQARMNEGKYDGKKTVLPSDFQREVPAECWKWLLKYGLSYSYWQAYCGYSQKDNRLIFPIGNPARFACGRGFNVVESKWKVYGDKSSFVEVVGEQLSGEIILVEDIVSAHKVAQVATSIPLFGTSINDNVVKKLLQLNRPVGLWLDNDQYGLLARKIGRLQALLGVPVRHIRTDKDPKEYSTLEIKEII